MQNETQTLNFTVTPNVFRRLRAEARRRGIDINRKGGRKAVVMAILNEHFQRLKNG